MKGIKAGRPSGKTGANTKSYKGNIGTLPKGVDGIGTGALHAKGQEVGRQLNRGTVKGGDNSKPEPCCD